MKEILTRATQGASPLLQDLMLTPGEKYYAFSVVDLEKRQRFSCERRFLIELLGTISEGEVEGYLKKFIAKIGFRNKFMGAQSPEKRQGILLFILKDHLIWGNSFLQIREKFFRAPFLFPKRDFPDKSMLAIYYGMLLFSLKEKWLSISEKYPLVLKKESIRYGKTALERLKREEETRKYLGNFLTKTTSPVGKLTVQALSSGNPGLFFEKLKIPYDFFLQISQRYSYLWQNFLDVVGYYARRSLESIPAGRIAREFKLLLFSENRSLLPSEKSPADIFCELIEKIDDPKLYDLFPQIDRTRVWALRNLKRYLGYEGIRRFLLTLPQMSFEERLERIRKLQEEAQEALGLSPKTVETYSWEIAAIIADIEDGKKFPEIIFSKRARHET